MDNLPDETEVEKALKYADAIERFAELSPNEKHIIALAKEVRRLQKLPGVK